MRNCGSDLYLRYARLRLRYARYDIGGGCFVRYDTIKEMLNSECGIVEVICI